MYKILFAILLAFIIQVSPALAWIYDSGYDEGPLPATKIGTNTDNFDGCLSGLETNVQLALDALDDCIGGGSGDNISVNGSAATDANFIDADILWTLNTGATPDTIAGNIGPNAVALGTDTTGDFVGKIIGGDGIDSTGASTGENITHTLSVDLITAASGSSTTGSYSGLEFVAGELALLQGCDDTEVLKWNETADRWQCETGGSAEINNLETITTGIQSGEILVGTGGNTAVYVAPSGDIQITGGGVVTIQPNAVALATDTTGDFVARIVAGNGMDSTGASTGENIAHTLSIDLASSDPTSATTGSFSGLEFVSTELTLLGGCNDGQILKWSDSANRWQCQNDNNSGSATAWNNINDATGDGAIAMGATVQTMDWDSGLVSIGAEDLLTLSFLNDAAVDVSTQIIFTIKSTSGTTNATEVLQRILNADASVAVPKALLIDSAGGAITLGIDLSDSDIVDALNVGANPIQTGNNPGTMGDSTTDSWTFNSDGTGTAEFVVPNDGISLGTETIGDYLQSATGTTDEVETSGASGEGSTPIFGLPDNVEVDGTLSVHGTMSIHNQKSLRFYEAVANGTNYAEFKDVAARTTTTTCTFENDSSFIPDSCVGDGTDASASGKEYYWPASAMLPVDVTGNVPPINQDLGTNITMLPIAFNDSTDECRTVNFSVPITVNTGGTVTIYCNVYSAATTSGNFILDFRHNGGVQEGVDPDQALTTVAAAADAIQGTAGQETHTEWTETMSNLGWVAKDDVHAMFCRDGNNGSDSLANDLLIIGCGILIP